MTLFPSVLGADSLLRKELFPLFHFLDNILFHNLRFFLIFIANEALVKVGLRFGGRIFLQNISFDVSARNIPDVINIFYRNIRHKLRG